MARENLWLVQCADRDGDDVDDLRKEHMAGHLAHIEASWITLPWRAH